MFQFLFVLQFYLSLCECSPVVNNSNSSPLSNQRYYDQDVDQISYSLTDAEGIGNWESESRENIMKCGNGLANNMRIISLPFVKPIGIEFPLPVHHSVWFEVNCGNGTILNYHADFAPNGVRRRFGHYLHWKE